MNQALDQRVPSGWWRWRLSSEQVHSLRRPHPASLPQPTITTTSTTFYSIHRTDSFNCVHTLRKKKRNHTGFPNTCMEFSVITGKFKSQWRNPASPGRKQASPKDISIPISLTSQVETIAERLFSFLFKLTKVLMIILTLSYLTLLNKIRYTTQDDTLLRQDGTAFNHYFGPSDKIFETLLTEEKMPRPHSLGGALDNQAGRHSTL